MKLVVLGDLIHDHYVYGKALRLCPEAPVAVLIPEREIVSDGGAGLVAAQLKELGADVITCFGSESTKHRYFAGSHLICRVDEDSQKVYSPVSIPLADVYVVADYGKGGMNYDLARQIVVTGKPVFVDAKHRWSWYVGAHSTAFPNEHEAIDSALGWDKIVRKLGAHGCQMGFVMDADFVKFPATVSEIADVTGAGDIFMGCFVFAFTHNFTQAHCLQFANAMAGESCRHLGTYVVPKAYAQSYLDRLLSSEASEKRLHENFLDSSRRGPRPHAQQDQSSAPSAAEITDRIRADYAQVAEEIRAACHNLPDAQTPPESHTAPTESICAHIPVDQETVDESCTKSLQAEQSPNSSGSDSPHAHKSALDPIYIEKKSRSRV